MPQLEDDDLRDLLAGGRLGVGGAGGWTLTLFLIGCSRSPCYADAGAVAPFAVRPTGATAGAGRSRSAPPSLSATQRREYALFFLCCNWHIPNVPHHNPRL